MSIFAESGSDATPNEAVTRSVPSPSTSGICSALDPLAHALGELVRALEPGLRQRDGHLLAAVARRLVDLARGLAQRVGDLLEHLVALQVPVGVVDALEVVDVEHDQPELVAEAPRALDLGRDDLLEAAVVEQAGQLVRDRLALDLLVQVDVLDRDRGLVREVLEQLALALAERPAGPGDRDHAEHAVLGLGRRERARERVRARDLRLGGVAGLDRGGLGRGHGGDVASTLPARAASASVPLAPLRMTTRPHSAPTPSTAVWTTIPSSASRSSPLPSDSPTRRTVSCSRARSSCSSSRRVSSWRAIELNSLPSAANSSLPSVGTCDREVALADVAARPSGGARSAAAASAPR